MLKVVIFLGYLVCVLALGGKFGAGRTGVRNLAVSIGVAAWLAHAWLLYLVMLSGPGLSINAGTAISFISWPLAGLGLAAVLRPALAGLGTILIALSAVGMAATGFGGQGYISSGLDWPLKAHILLSAAAYSLLSLAAALAVLLAVQDQRLRNHRPLGWFRHLPALEEMESLMFGAIAVGFTILTLALFSGLIFVEDLFAQHLVHKTVLSVASWLIFGIIVFGRWRYHWRGRTALLWVLGGFVVLALAYFGSKIVLELLLGRQWG